MPPLLQRLYFQVNDVTGLPVVGAVVSVNENTCLKDFSFTATTNGTGLAVVYYGGCSSPFCKMDMAYTVTSSGHTTQSGNYTGECGLLNQTVRVTVDRTVGCTNNNECPSGECCKNGVCTSCGGTSNFDWLLVVIGVIAAVAIAVIVLHFR